MGPGSPPRLPDRDLLGAVNRAVSDAVGKSSLGTVDRAIERDARRTVWDAVYVDVNLAADWSVGTAVEDEIRHGR